MTWNAEIPAIQVPCCRRHESMAKPCDMLLYYADGSTQAACGAGVWCVFFVNARMGYTIVNILMTFQQAWNTRLTVTAMRWKTRQRD